MKRALALPLIAALTAVLLAGCGGSGSTADAVDYTKFCGLAAEMETAAQGTHGENPAAITEADVMKDTWSKMVSMAEALRDESPEAIKEDVTLMVSTIVEMNKVFADNDYNLIEMAKNEEVRKKLESVSTREGVEAASNRFDAFMEKNCTE